MRPTSSLTGPASAIDRGISERDRKKSRLETRPSSSGGTRRWSSVPQMTMPAWKVAPMTAPATSISHRSVVNPKTTSGRVPAPQSRFMTVR